MEQIKKDITSAIEAARKIVIIQADNPDGDSLASSLALEQILGDMGKEPIMYCGVDIPSYMRYLAGSDRVVKELPNQFDLSIMVDCSTVSLLEQLEKTNQIGALSTRPAIVIDHHSSELNLPYDATVLVIPEAVATGEVLFDLAQELRWPLNQISREMMVSSIMSDSLGLTSEGTSAKSIHTVATLVEQGVSLAELEARRRTTMTKPLPIIKYKGKLLERIEYFVNDQLALITIPWDEIEEFSPYYNPSMLALEELRLAEGVRISVSLKVYQTGRITGKIRCNHGTLIADKLAGHFGGGGHPYAAGFKTTEWEHDELVQELVKQTAVLLDEADQNSVS